MVVRRKSKAVLSPWNFFNFVLVSFIFVAIFVGAFLIQKPKELELIKSTLKFRTQVVNFMTKRLITANHNNSSLTERTRVVNQQLELFVNLEK